MLAPEVRYPLLQEIEVRVRRCEPVEEIAAYARDRGASKLDSVSLLVESGPIGLGGAKSIAQSQCSVRDRRKQDEHIFDDLDE